MVFLDRISFISPTFSRFFSALIFAIMSQENSTVFVEIATFGALNFLTFARRMNGQDVPLDLIFAMRHVRIAHLAMKEGL